MANVKKCVVEFRLLCLAFCFDIPSVRLFSLARARVRTVLSSREDMTDSQRAKYLSRICYVSVHDRENKKIAKRLKICSQVSVTEQTYGRA